LGRAVRSLRAAPRAYAPATRGAISDASTAPAGAGIPQKRATGIAAQTFLHSAAGIPARGRVPEARPRRRMHGRASAPRIVLCERLL